MEGGAQTICQKRRVRPPAGAADFNNPSRARADNYGSSSQIMLHRLTHVVLKRCKVVAGETMEDGVPMKQLGREKTVLVGKFNLRDA